MTIDEFIDEISKLNVKWTTVIGEEIRYKTLDYNYCPISTLCLSKGIGYNGKWQINSRAVEYGEIYLGLSPTDAQIIVNAADNLCRNLYEHSVRKRLLMVCKL